MLAEMDQNLNSFGKGLNTYLQLALTFFILMYVPRFQIWLVNQKKQELLHSEYILYLKKQLHESIRMHT